MTDTELLGIVSFCVLMQTHDGIAGQAPNYIDEKLQVLKAGAGHMWAALDGHNQLRVLEWGKKWGVDFESLISQITKDYWNIHSAEYREKYKVI